MSAQDLDHPTSARNSQPDEPASLPWKVNRPRFNILAGGIALIVVLLLLILVIAVIHAPNAWIVVYLVGLVVGFALGTVFGISVARRLGSVPNLQRFSFATGLVLLSACVGFFGSPSNQLISCFSPSEPIQHAQAKMEEICHAESPPQDVSQAMVEALGA
ncbi:MAG: hypothetical protein HYX68_12375, partial [Planctomycetes bacterium]|nr:hypothetical protein [Planctomycetota bacterium]